MNSLDDLPKKKRLLETFQGEWLQVQRMEFPVEVDAIKVCRVEVPKSYYRVME